MSYKKLFREAFELERSIYAAIEQMREKARGEVEVFYEHEKYPIGYSRGSTQAPLFIRAICFIQSIDDLRWLKKTTIKMSQAWEKAVRLKDGDFGRVPNRYPVFLNNANFIKLTKTSAIKSQKLDKNELIPIISTRSKWPKNAIIENKETTLVNYQQILQDKGIRCEIIKQVLVAKSNDIINMVGTSNIQIRKRTGSAYRASVYFKDGSNQNIKLGFLICNTMVSVIKTPQNHQNIRTIDKLAKKIDFGFQTANTEFWFYP